MASVLVSLNNIEMTMGSKLLFEDLSLGIFEGEKIGLIGPNGAGKSTLLKIISGQETPDEGEVSQKRSARVSYLTQHTEFKDQETILNFTKTHLLKSRNTNMDDLEAEVQASIYLSTVGFEDLEVKVGTLSGGWKKRLSIAMTLAEEADLLILDEPTNHMDWDGILWLEDWLKNYKKTLILVSHDRVFLDNCTNRTIEINSLYKDGYISFNCNYEKFLEKKEEYVQAQMSLQQTMSNKARREIDWLRAGVKARTTKSSSRMKEAYELLDNLDSVKERNRSVHSKSRLEIDSTERKTKKLLEFKKLNIFYGDNFLIKDLDLVLGPKSCLGLLGQNGSGKTSLLNVIQGVSENFSGTIKKADDLKIVYFDQKREALPQDINLMQYLGEGGDHAVFKNQSIHVASYASRFLFSAEKMNMRISQLSGGEQARLLIAKIFLQPADILILDEPTNDLDIETIEVIEETMQNFEGLLILVSHDRKFLSQLCHKYLALDGQGGWATYADVDQWLKTNNKKQENKTNLSQNKNNSSESIENKAVKLSYKEKKQLETIEQDILKAEENLKKAQKALEDPSVFADHQKMLEATVLAGKAQEHADQLYALWDILEAKK